MHLKKYNGFHFFCDTGANIPNFAPVLNKVEKN